MVEKDRDRCSQENPQRLRTLKLLGEYVIFHFLMQVFSSCERCCLCTRDPSNNSKVLISNACNVQSKSKFNTCGVMWCLFQSCK